VLQLEQATGAFRMLYCSFASNLHLCTESSELEPGSTFTTLLLEIDVNMVKLHSFPVFKLHSFPVRL